MILSELAQKLKPYVLRWIGSVGSLIAPGGPIGSPDSYSAGMLAMSPLGYWRLGESVGVTAVDAGPNHIDGTYANTPTLGVAGAIDGDADTAVQFNGSDEYVDLSAHASFEFGTGAFTVMLWVKRDAGWGVGYQTFVSKDSGGTGWYGQFIGTTQVLRFGTRKAADIDYMDCTVAIADTDWHFIALRRTAAGFKQVFLDGGWDANSSTHAVNVDSGVSLMCGQIASTQYFDGTVDELAVWNRALTDVEILENYHRNGDNAFKLTAPTIMLDRLTGSPWYVERHPYTTTPYRHVESGVGTGAGANHEYSVTFTRAFNAVPNVAFGPQAAVTGSVRATALTAAGMTVRTGDTDILVSWIAEGPDA